MASHSDGAADPSLAADIQAHVCGEASATERLYTRLEPTLRITARRMLGDEHPDVEDIVQEAALATLGHLTRSGGFSGNLVHFSVTVVRNRCRNLLAWRRRHPHAQLEKLTHLLESASGDPLEVLLQDEIDALIQKALDQLDDACRDLLAAYYLRRESAESIRQRLGLGVLQSVYYRRDVCLDRAAQFLEKRLSFCSRPEERRVPSAKRAEGDES